MELLALLKTCWKRKWIIVAFTIILPILTIIVSVKMTKVYEAVAKVKLIQFEDTQSLLQKQIPEEWGNLDHVTGVPTESQAEVIRSRMVVEPVIRQLNLKKRVTIIDKILKFLGIIDEYPDEIIRLEKLVEPGYIGAFLQRRQIFIEPVEDSDIITIYGYSDVLEEARDMANAIAQSYVEQAGKLKQQKAQEALAIIEKNLESAKDELAKTQNDLKMFQETHYVVNMDARINDIQKNLNDLENEYVSVQNDLSIRTSLLKELTEATFDPSVLQAALKSTEAYPHIQELESKLMDLQSSMAALLIGKTAKHPAAMELQAQIDGIKKELFNEIKRLLGNEIIELNRTRDALQGNMANIKADLKRIADTKRQEEDLQRQVDSAETLYLSFKASYDSALTAAATNYGNATIITDAELPDPDDPYYPEPPLYTILAIVIGVMFGFGMAFIVEFMDLSVKTIEDIEKATDVPVLGVVPKAGMIDRLRNHTLNGSGKLAGALLEIKHNILKRANEKRVIAVSSALNKEGKTYIVSHFAMALSQQGYKVALVDLNLKKPAIHKFFNLKDGSGVAGFLTRQNEDFAGVIKSPAGFPTLSILTAGTDAHSALPTLGSPALQDLIDILKKDFDYVLLDAAAQDALAGGTVVAAKADTTFLIVSSEGPSPRQLVEAIAALKEADANLAGIIANRV